MIVASLLLILVAAVLLVLGLVRGIDLLLVVSIAVSLLAAVALYVGARQSRSNRSTPADDAGDNGEPAGESTETAEMPASEPAYGESALRRGGQVPDLPGRRVSGARTDPTRSGAVQREFADLDPANDPDPWDHRPPWPLDRTAAEPTESVPTIPVGRFPDEPGRYGMVIPDVESDNATDDPMDEPPVQRTSRSDADLVARLPAEVLVVDGRPRYHVTGCPHLLGKDSEPLPVAEAVELGFNPCGWCQPDTVLLGGTPEL
ncbi:hypothetical protein [Actinocatenispora rupis]|uniref:Clumping factor A n=1 Tax=Actinocatenispora rupis TaxID=519421 RepID=A0A8J3J0K2_9ACTN|nr:hypothetical protein Aru02nite_01900 [Actinocatenispora rupis]